MINSRRQAEPRYCSNQSYANFPSKQKRASKATGREGGGGDVPSLTTMATKNVIKKLHFPRLVFINETFIKYGFLLLFSTNYSLVLLVRCS